ncbi:neutral/alkaline non-lysosomal ceramidase N-terminal domain-containing protein [candidate division KSB1 bacterium]|nr:neutral/alkaline non-lysosomal ceramidase N-terminal domain-containing protein [candidate division KSB1 bacterium]
MKLLLKILLSFILILFIIIIISIRSVDYTPYFLTSYYETTIDSLKVWEDRLAVLPKRAEKAGFQAGFSKISVTPGLGVPLAGYADRNGLPNHGVHDSLFASTLAIKSGSQEVLLVGIDALIVPRKLAEAVMAVVGPKTGFKRYQILFGATHTHSGPGAWQKGWLAQKFAGNYDDKTFQFLTRQISQSIIEAYENLSSAKIGFSSINLPEFTKNRLVKEKGTIDPEFSFGLVQFAALNQVLLGSYSAHATTLSGENMRYSGDYPGYWVRRIETQPTRKAFFMAGGVGSHSPKAIGQNFERSRYIGEATADSVLKYVDSVQFDDLWPVFSIGIKVNLPEPHIRISNHWRLAPWLARKIVFENDTWLQLVRIGSTIIIGAPADFSGEIAAQLKDYAHRLGYRLVVTSFNGSYIGYIVPSKYYHLNEYESRLMSFFGPTIGDYFPDLMRRMIDLAILNK